MNTRTVCSLVVLFSLRINVVAQTVSHLPSTVQMTGYDTRGSRVSAHTNSTMLSFTLEGDTTGAAIVPMYRKSPIRPGPELGPDEQAEFRGMHFSKTGGGWTYSDDTARLSPDQAWLVLQSYTGTVADNDEIPDLTSLRSLFRRYHGRVFCDVFNADTGRKLLTINGSYSTGYPNAPLHKTAWVTERYFIVPLGEDCERCLVCEFGSVRQKEGTSR
jgi:hypothetical protein